MRAFGVIPAPVFEAHLPEGVAGEARGPIIRIRHGRRHDAGLLAHELEHVEQWWVLFGTYSLLAVAALAAGYPTVAGILFGAGIGAHPVVYWLSRDYRLDCEVEAYRRQMDHGMVLEQAADRLALPRYALGLDVEQARQLLQEDV